MPKRTFLVTTKDQVSRVLTLEKVYQTFFGNIWSAYLVKDFGQLFPLVFPYHYVKTFVYIKQIKRCSFP